MQVFTNFAFDNQLVKNLKFRKMTFLYWTHKSKIK